MFTVTGKGCYSKLKYRIIDHTADIGIQVYGQDMNRLFTNAAHALFDFITDTQLIDKVTEKKIAVSGEDWPDLMVNWLRELLCLWTVEDSLVRDVNIKQVSEYSLRAIAIGEPYDPNRHVIKEEIKAVTYHQIDVHPGSSGWEARIIFDV